MTSYEDLVALWGQDWVIHLPIDQLGEAVTCGPDPLPPYGAMPIEVPLLFSTLLDGNIGLFSVLNIEAGDEQVMRLVALGAVPDDHDMLFCLDGASGGVQLLQVSEPGLELVNSSMRAFVDFLYHVTSFVREENRGEQRVAGARELQRRLARLDPAAFADAESWWSMAFDLGLARL
jgi:hypothetical protein